MIVGMTLGIGEIICLPMAICERYEMSKRYYSLTFWYDANGIFTGYYEGDIRDMDDSWLNWSNGRETMEPNKRVDQTGSSDVGKPTSSARPDHP